MPRGTFLLKESKPAGSQTPTEVTAWVVVNGAKVGRITISLLNSATGKAVNYKEVWY